jgi:hypothetical protein
MITRLRITGPGKPTSPGSPVTLKLTLTPTTSGPATVLIERFDPSTGWHFDRALRTSISAGGGSVTFVPAIGQWRARATFDGTHTAQPSATGGYVKFLVAGPLMP